MTSTPLDISGDVTAEQHAAVYGNLLEIFENWRMEQGWCTDLYLYVAQLSQTFHWNRHVEDYYPGGYTGRMETDLSLCTTNAERGQDLRELRGRILRFTLESPDYLNIRRANEFLRGAGLPEWSETEQPQPPARIYVETYGYIPGGATELTEQEIRDKITRYMTRTLRVENASVNVHTEQPRRRRSYEVVPTEDTTELLRRPGRNY